MLRVAQLIRRVYLRLFVRVEKIITSLSYMFPPSKARYIPVRLVVLEAQQVLSGDFFPAMMPQLAF